MVLERRCAASFLPSGKDSYRVCCDNLELTLTRVMGNVCQTWAGRREMSKKRFSVLLASLPVSASRVQLKQEE